MKKIVIFAGTTEGRRLSEILADAGIAHTVCVATEYGEIVMREQTDAEAAGTKGQPLVSVAEWIGSRWKNFCVTRVMRS